MPAANFFRKITVIVQNGVNFAMYDTLQRLEHPNEIGKLQSISNDEKIEVTNGALLAGGDRTENNRQTDTIGVA